MKTLYRRSEYFTHKSFPLVVMRDVVHSNDVARHTHEFTELVIVSGGRGVHVTAAESRPIGRGDVFVIRGEEPHAYRSTAHLAIVNILYLPTRLSYPEDDLQMMPGYHALFAFPATGRTADSPTSSVRLSKRELSHTMSLADLLDTELQRHRRGFRAMATSLFMQIVTGLSRCYEHAMELGPTEPAHNVRIARAVAHLETHAHQELRLEDLAAQVDMSRRTFQRLFKEMVGTSPMDYLLRTRVNRAARMLAQGYTGSMGRLADAAGFGDANYFSRQFKAVMGVSPRAYARTVGPD